MNCGSLSWANLMPSGSAAEVSLCSLNWDIPLRFLNLSSHPPDPSEPWIPSSDTNRLTFSATAAPLMIAHLLRICIQIPHLGCALLLYKRMHSKDSLLALLWRTLAFHLIEPRVQCILELGPLGSSSPLCYRLCIHFKPIVPFLQHSANGWLAWPKAKQFVRMLTYFCLRGGLMLLVVAA